MGRETGDDENRLAFQEGPDGDRQVAVRGDQVLQARVKQQPPAQPVSAPA